MKKGLKYLSLVFGISIGMIFVGNIKSKALTGLGHYNGVDEPGFISSASGSCSSVFGMGKELCRYRLNQGFSGEGIRVSFVYADGAGNYTQLGNSLDIWKQAPSGISSSKFKCSNNGKAQARNATSLGSFSSGCDYVVMGDLTLASSWLQSKFYDFDVLNEYAQELTGHELTDASYFDSSRHEEADPTGAHPAEKGYRFFIEMIRTFTDSSGNFYSMSFSEYASLGASGMNLQESYYFKPSNGHLGADTLHTSFKDIGISVPTVCSDAYACTFSEVSNPTIGHTLHIIDFTDFMEDNSCDYDTGTGFPDSSKTNWDDLTDSEKDCCTEKIEEIKDTYATKLSPTYDTCILNTPVSLDEYGNCLKENFNKIYRYSEAAMNLRDDLRDVETKYPACVTCDYDEIEAIEDNYFNCIHSSVNFIDWLIAFLEGCETVCETTRSSALTSYLTTHPYCNDEYDIDVDCAFSSCPLETSHIAGTCTPPGTSTPSGPTPVPIPDPGGGCDPDNPDDFPNSSNGFDTTCCVYFEAQWMAYYASTVGDPSTCTSSGCLVGDHWIKIQEWFNAEDYRKYCLDPTGSTCPTTIGDLTSEIASGTITDPDAIEDCCDELLTADPTLATNPEFLAVCPVGPTCDLTTLPTLTGNDLTDCCDDLKADPTYSYITDWSIYGCPVTPSNVCTWTEYGDPVISGLEEIETRDCEAVASTTTEVKDTVEWDCIYGSVDIPSSDPQIGIFKDYYAKYKNPYCGVYCREDVEHEFPSYGTVVKAGSHFTVDFDKIGGTGVISNWDTQIRVKDTRTCQTGNNETGDGVNTAKIERDYNTNASIISTSWDTIQINTKKQNLLGYATYLGDCMGMNGSIGAFFGIPNYWSIPYDVWHYNGAEVYVDAYCTADITYTGMYRTYDLEILKAQIAKTGAENNLELMKFDLAACSDWTKFDEPIPASIKKYPSSATVEAEAYSIIGGNPVISDTPDRDRTYNATQTLRSKYLYPGTDLGTYSAATDNIEDERYHKYATYDEFVEYIEWDPDIKLDFASAYPYNDKLEKVDTTDPAEKKVENFVGSATVPSITCTTGSPCSVPAISVSTSQSKATYAKERKYRLASGVWDYVKKPQGTPSSGMPPLAAGEYALALGYSALHVEYMRPSGDYPIGLNFINRYSPEGVTSEKTNFDKVGDKNSPSITSYEFSCKYTVDNTIITPPSCTTGPCTPIPSCTTPPCTPVPGFEGLNLVYRPVSLTDPFPGTSGTGRTPGANWIGNEDAVEYGRGVSGNQLYNLQPMYEITLTPALIRQIRNHNDGTNYNDFDMDCDGSGRNCTSNYLRTLPGLNGCAVGGSC